MRQWPLAARPRHRVEWLFNRLIDDLETIRRAIHYANETQTSRSSRSAILLHHVWLVPPSFLDEARTKEGDVRGRRAA